MRKIVQWLEHQNLDQGFRRTGRATALGRNDSLRSAINPARQCGKVKLPNNLDRRITQAIDFRGPGFSSKQITFDCTAWLRQPASD